jgi:CheY-like chemotaxis protein
LVGWSHGPWRLADEVAWCHAWLARRCSSSSVKLQQADDLDAAARLLAADGSAADLIVLAESRPGEFAAASIDALRRLAPLARVWRLVGSWCEGEARSGRVPPGCLTTYWHQWQSRWTRELARASAGDSPAWALPATLSAEERALAAMEYPLAHRAGLIAICARHAQTAAALSDACKLAGYSTRVVCEGQSWEAAGALALIWDAECDRMKNREQVAKLRACAGGAPVLALAGFPRVDDFRAAAEAGVAAVISKPFLVHDLVWHLDQVASANPAGDNQSQPIPSPSSPA